MIGVVGKLGAGGQRGEGRAVVWQAKRGVGDVGATAARLSGKVAHRSGLALDLGFGRVGGQRGGVVLLLVLLLLGQPGGRVSAGRRQGRGDASFLAVS